MSGAVRHVMIVGYGAMGSGIARSFAEAGFETTVMSRDPGRYGAVAGIAFVADVPSPAPDLVIEAVPEVMETKIALLRRLEEACGDETILASNTSGLDLQAIADAAARPERVVGAHYMHPADVMPMVELIRVRQTSDDVFARTKAALEATGKQTLDLQKPVIGFLINRLQHALYHEAYHLMQTGVAGVEEIDAVARNLLGPRMSVTGMLEQKDLSGLDVHARAQQSIVPELCHSATSHKVIQDKLANGELGIKTGTGFYDWRGRDVEARKREAAAKIAKVLAVLAEP
jgi:3-hydroxybutyryl-CoA dehydrogenase